ncbi:MAG: hypothetical protein Q9187_006009, partial [Circinaria calcarea]
MDEDQAEEILNHRPCFTIPGKEGVSLAAGQVIVKRVLGVGGQGSAFLVGGENSRRLYVAKVLAPEALSDTDTFSDELVKGPEKATEARILLKYLKEPSERIISLLAMNMSHNHAVLYYEFCDAGDLQKVMTGFWKHRQHVPEGFLWHVFGQLTEAVAFIHRASPDPAATWGPVLHCDLKPPNVFLKWVTGDYLHARYPNVMLGDFGLATPLRRGLLARPYENGTPPYCAPEWPRTSRKSDVWGI